jgi:hypothetical protein
MSETKSKAKVAEQASQTEQKQNSSINSDAAYRKLFNETPFLEDENEKLYGEIHNAIVEDLQPQSFLEKIAVRDLATKLFDELRYKNAIVGLIEGARNSAEKYADEDEREYYAVEKYLPHLQKLQRLNDNNETARRSIVKEFRRKARADKDAPLIMPNGKANDE